MNKQQNNSFRNKKKDIARKKSSMTKLNKNKPNQNSGLQLSQIPTLNLSNKKPGSNQNKPKDAEADSAEQSKLSKFIKNPKFKRGILALAMILIGGLLFLASRINAPKVYTEGYYFKDLNIDIDPLKTDSTGANQVLLNLLYLNLTRQNSQGSYESYILDINIREDGKSYSLKFKNKLKWSDGKDVSAEDLMFSLNQFIKNSSSQDENKAFKGATTTKVSDNEVTLVLNYADGSLNKHLSQVLLAPKHNYKTESGALVQTDDEIFGGPYIYRGLNLIEGGLQVKLSANEDYKNYEKVTNKKVNLRFVDSKDKLIHSFNQGLISASPQLDSFDVSSSAKSYVYQTPGQAYAFFNSQTITDVNLRKALAYSINQKKITEVANKTENTNLLNKFQLPAGQDGGSLGFNQEEAAKLYDQTGYKKNGDNLVKADTNTTLKLKLVAADDALSTKVAEELATQLKQQGISLEVTLVSAQQLKDEYFVSHAYDILIYGIDMGIKPDLKTYWSSNQTNKDLNFSNLSDPKLEGLIVAYGNSANQDQKNQNLVKFSQTWTSLAPAKPLYVQNLSLISRYNIGSTGDNTVVDLQDYINKIPYFQIGSK